MNVRLLRKIAKVIQEKPEEFDMAEYHCGSTHCIGGWAQVLSGQTLTSSYEDPMELLGLTTDEAFRLFHQEEWPSAFRKANNPLIAVARIAHFIKTKGAE